MKLERFFANHEMFFVHAVYIVNKQWCIYIKPKEIEFGLLALRE